MSDEAIQRDPEGDGDNDYVLTRSAWIRVRDIVVYLQISPVSNDFVIDVSPVKDVEATPYLLHRIPFR